MVLTLKEGVIFFLMIISLVSYFPFVNADILSINTAGSTEFVLTTDRYIEGFFFGIPIFGCTDPDANNFNSDATRDDGSCTFDDDPGAGGGGGGVATGNLVLTPSWNTSEGIDLQIGTTRDEHINVTNLGESSVNSTLTHNFGDYLQILGGDALTIEPGETVTFNIRFIAGEDPGVVSGTITISGQNIQTTLEISTELILFDSSIIVLNDDSTVVQGDPLMTRITLVPLGDPNRVDVTLNYIIRDFENEIYSTSSETLLVEEQTVIDREFNTGSLPNGDYVIGLELVYPGGLAPSSAFFRVVEREVSPLVGKIILFLIIIILILAIILLIILIIKKRRDDEEEPLDNQTQTSAFPLTRSGF